MVAKGLCVRGELETGQTSIYWPQIPLSLAAFFLVPLGCSTGGPESPAHSGSWFSLHHLISNSLKLSVTPGYIIVWHPPASCGRHICTQFNPSTVNVIPWYLRPDAPIIYTGASLIWQLGRGSICYMIIIKMIGNLSALTKIKLHCNIWSGLSHNERLKK